ncbi:V-type proton ATPase subunit G 1-like [Hypanus sabinus]|uniref:V-type proton ATPase subunit G 1-like n=1 Tax=Hypanus sabinus TaxID=79690 RepID=UPI0028C3855E|nr:V-type proton ATPase subunit G 1-like [Hypanus sabinus]
MGSTLGVSQRAVIPYAKDVAYEISSPSELRDLVALVTGGLKVIVLAGNRTDCADSCLNFSLFTGKNRRLKQAKEEAQAEIEQYRLQREKEFKNKEDAALGSHGDSATEVDKDTQEKIKVIRANYEQHKEIVLNNLLNLICDIKPEIHVNFRING